MKEVIMHFCIRFTLMRPVGVIMPNSDVERKAKRMLID